MALDSMDILTILILIHEPRIAFHLLVAFVFFISVLGFLVYRSLAFLAKFIFRYTVVLGAIVNGIVFCICISDSVLVYRNVIDFCMLIFISWNY